MKVHAAASVKLCDRLSDHQLLWSKVLINQVWILCLSLSDSTISSLSKATSIIREFLKQPVVRFRPYDVQDLLQPLISRPPPADAVEQVKHSDGRELLLLEGVWWWNETKLRVSK